MKILLDECVPLPMRRLLVDHECRSAQEMGWKSIRNSELLKLAEAQFDLFITADQGLAYQQNLRDREIRDSSTVDKQASRDRSCCGTVA